jgi:hypothetical protein
MLVQAIMLGWWHVHFCLCTVWRVPVVVDHDGAFKIRWQPCTCLLSVPASCLLSVPASAPLHRLLAGLQGLVETPPLVPGAVPPAAPRYLRGMKCVYGRAALNASAYPTCQLPFLQFPSTPYGVATFSATRMVVDNIEHAGGAPSTCCFRGRRRPCSFCFQ